MAEFDGIFKCTLGTADFQLRDYGVSEEAVIEPGIGRTFTRSTVAGEGWVEGSSPADFAAKLATVAASFRVDGQDFFITGLGGEPEYAMLAARSMAGGPWVKRFEIQPVSGEAGLVKSFRFELANDVEAQGKDNQKYTAKVQTRPDGLRTITYNGEMTGRGSGGVAARFTGGLLPQLQQKYPFGQWVPTVEYESNVQDDLLTFGVAFVELSQSLAHLSDEQAQVCSGELEHSEERDEQYRIVTRAKWDLLITGDPYAVLAKIRPADPPPIRESFAYTRYQEARLQAEFVLLTAADGSDLMDWEQTIDVPVESAPVVAFEYVGRDPVFALGNPVHRATQRGRAVGAGRYVRPPAYAFSLGLNARLAERPRVSFRPLNDVERETTWEFQFAFNNAPQINAGVLAALGRPKAPQFV